jgi:hypothetical protein
MLNSSRLPTLYPYCIALRRFKSPFNRRTLSSLRLPHASTATLNQKPQHDYKQHAGYSSNDDGTIHFSPPSSLVGKRLE